MVLPHVKYLVEPKPIFFVTRAYFEPFFGFYLTEKIKIVTLSRTVEKK